MDNPFNKRATEYVRDEEAFLSIVSPDPLRYYLLKDRSEAEALYDRLVLLLGQPGSGKTTIARVFEYTTIAALLRNRDLDTYREIVKTVRDCHVIEGDRAAVIGCRLPMELDYRDFWELPYGNETKAALFFALVQARAVLAWLRQLEADGIDLTVVTIGCKPGTEAATEAIGGTGAAAVREKARRVEGAIYKIVGSILPPRLDEMSPDATGAYKPFDVLDRIVIRPTAASPLSVLPLVIFDDAHQLHQEQYGALKQWLTRRELKIARWIMSRLDAMSPTEALQTISADPSPKLVMPGVTIARDVTLILFQTPDRADARRYFRRMARDMSGRYLKRISIFRGRELTNLAGLLLDTLEPPSETTLRTVAADLQASTQKLKVSDKQTAELRREVDQYLVSTRREHEADIACAMLKILLHRFAKRVPEPTRRSVGGKSSGCWHSRTSQLSRMSCSSTGPFSTALMIFVALFAELEDHGDFAKPPKADASVYEGARLHLLHLRPYMDSAGLLAWTSRGARSNYGYRS